MTGVRTARDDGFTLTELLFVVFILGVLVALAIASFTTASSRARKSTCFANQRALTDVVIEYQVDNSGARPADVADLEPYVVNFDSVERCPSDSDVELSLDASTGIVSCSIHPR